MKKILLSLGAIGLVSTAFAQLPVSTTAENKNVVLEEYTGIYCQFCPDGHVRAQQLQSNNPGDVVLINVHVGGFAAPNAGDPDFRTMWGQALDDQADVTGYPAGSVNRRTFAGVSQGSGSAMSRGDWDASATTVLGESSYANVALEGRIDATRRILEVEVQTYFTADAGTDVNLTVAVMQNNVEGPQTGGATYNPSDVLPNGNYNHKHMLRHFMTGQWGDVITTTTTGTTVTRTYAWAIPADINGVAVDLSNLEVAAFIAEGTENIITGANGTIVNASLPNYVLVDAEIGSAFFPADYCFADITPEVTVTNGSSETITEYEVSYSLNGAAPVSQTITTPLAAGASATHTFNAVSTADGAGNIEYSVNASQELDTDPGNNSTSGNFIKLPATPGVAPYTQDFEGTPLFGLPANAFLENPFGARVFTVDQNISTAVTWALGGFGQSASCLRWDYYAIGAGIETSLLIENVDLSSYASAELTFAHAYAQYAAENDRLEVFASSDCGANWTSVYNKAGSDLATVAPVGTGRFYPQASEWVGDTVDLSAFAGNVVTLKFTGTSDFGNNLYFDDVNVTGSSSNPGDTNNPGDTTGIASRVDILESVTLFPNPAAEAATLEVKSSEATTIEVLVYDVVGKVVLQEAPRSMSIGVEQITLNTSTLTDGVYYVTLLSNGQHQTEKLVIRK